MESRYRTIHCKMWGDEWFLALTQPQPCGAWLWIWLLTGELTDVVPGLIRSGELGMAEALGWSVEDFRKAFAEVEREGKVQASWKHRLRRASA